MLTAPLLLTLSLLSQVDAGPPLAVDVSSGRHPISPDIYGMNSYSVTTADGSFHAEVRVPVTRMGGDAASRYNWRLDASNSGFDWYFMAGSGETAPVPNATADTVIQLATSSFGRTLLTIPLVPYLNSVGPGNDCSYPSTQFPDQQSFNPYVQPNGYQCGNGVLTDGGSPILLSQEQINRINTPNSTGLATEWVQYLVTRYGSAADGGVLFYNLDNEPSGWSNTHRDIVPVNPPYAGDGGLTELGIQFATAIKAADPTALTLGPVDFGYPVYQYAAGYLDAMAAAAASAGHRLLDYLDEHYYPSTNLNEAMANTTAAGSAALQTQRLESTRSLWDPTYSDQSWIGQYNPPIQLIPYFKQLIAAHYPGTKLAISEYNWGGTQSMNGALAEADVLGIFGREGLDLATMWGPPASTDAVAYAFRIYRNYDGQGSSYGDTWVSSTSGDATNAGQGTLAIYGAQRTSDGALTLVVLNKTGGDLTSAVTLAGFTPSATAQVWQYSPANLTAVVRQADVPVSTSGLSTTFPANSITLLVVASTTVATPPDAGPPDSGTADGGPNGGGGNGSGGGSPGGPASVGTGVQGGCSSAPGTSVGSGLLAFLFLALSRPRGPNAPRRRSRRE
ncbi:MAG: glycoside hydrolase family 44 protein [Myxococcaceae bacterium]